MPSFFIAAVRPKEVAQNIAAVHANAKHKDLWWWNPDHRLVVKLRHLEHVNAEAARKALHDLHLLAPVAGVKVLQTTHLHKGKDLWVNVLGLEDFADAVYKLTRNCGSQQTFVHFKGHMTLAWSKAPHAKIEVNLPPEQIFNVEELVLLRKPDDWGPYEFVDKVQLHQYCHCSGHHSHC